MVPAAFMAHTGRDHWEVLLRARAIENQCYVVAAGQIGDHEPGAYAATGAAWSIDPWGTVVAQAPDDGRRDRRPTSTSTGSTRIRSELPSLANRRL